MTTIATGVFKKLSYKKQSALGTPATGSGAQYLRRVTSTIDLKKATYESSEIRPSMMRSDMRHGMRTVEGTINGELSVGSYTDLMASVLRQGWQTAATTGALSDVTAASTSGTNGTFTRGTGDFLTDGFKIGDVLRWTGWTAGATANNDHNFLITGLTDTVMTVSTLDGTAVVAKAAGDSVTGTLVGKKTFVPTSGHTRDYYTIEHWFSDINQSESFADCVIDALNIKLPATGMATVDVPVKGLSMTTDTSEQFTSPTAATSGAVLAAVNGAIYVGGTKVGLVTSADINISGNHTMPDGVVGSDVAPDIYPGVITVSGSLSVLFTDATMRDYFVNETEVSVFAVFTGANTADADFIAFALPRTKMGGADKNDGETGLTMTMPFTALENTAGGTGTNTVASVISIQDSLAT